MRCIVQRVKSASLTIDGNFSGNIDKGLVVFCAFCDSDDEFTVDYCVNKITNLRIFNDEKGKMNLSVLDVSGNIMLVSNFTLYGETGKGRRPSFEKSSNPQKSLPLYLSTVEKFRQFFPNIISGKFGADMQISLINDGPVTLTVEKKNE